MKALGGAQRPSCNIVGYVDRTFIANGYTMISNPFNAYDNHVPALLPSVPYGSKIWKWDDVTQSWIQNSFYTSWSVPTMTLVPGEGCQFQNSSASPITRSFVGEVQLGYSVNGVANYWSIRSSVIPQSGRLVTDLGLPVLNGDTVMRKVNGVDVTYTYNNGVWSPSEPTVSIGESFWNYKSLGLFWTRNFLGWPWP